MPHNKLTAVLMLMAATAAIPAKGEILGSTIALSCANCHGTDGALAKPGLPELAGRPARAIEESLLDFKYGRASSTIMDRIARGYSDAELAAVARYFSELK